MTREEALKAEYEAKLRALKQEQSNCAHEWGDSKYDPEIKREPYGQEMVTQGSDVWWVPQGYRDVEHKRWSRTCKKCGKVEYTTQTVVLATAPKF
jgi:hypothetical protein